MSRFHNEARAIAFGEVGETCPLVDKAWARAEAKIDRNTEEDGRVDARLAISEAHAVIEYAKERNGDLRAKLIEAIEARLRLEDEIGDLERDHRREIETLQDRLAEAGTA